MNYGLGARQIGWGLGVSAPGGALPAWWYVAGKTAVGAYKAVGAASYAASKINLANPGIYDAVNGD